MPTSPAEGLAAEVRRQLVGMLTAAGMSTRAIAPTLGVTKSQVSRDGTPDPGPTVHDLYDPAFEHIDLTTGEVRDLDEWRREQIQRAW